MKNFFLDSNNNRISIICLVISLICIYFLNNDSYFKLNHTGQNQFIGIFETVRKEARRKSSFSYFWEDVSARDELIEGDSIYTGPNSSVEVKLQTGQLLTIQPNSLVKFKMKNNKLTIDIPYGNLQLDSTSSELVISDCGQNYPLENDRQKMTIQKSDKCGSIKVAINSARLKDKINSISQTENSIDELLVETVNQSWITDKEQQIDVSNLPATPVVSPELLVSSVGVENQSIKNKTTELTKAPQFLRSKYDYDLLSSKSLEVKWKSVVNATRYILQISESPHFETSQKIVTTQTSYILPKTDRAVYFRVQAEVLKEVEKNGQLVKEKTMTLFSKLAELNVSYPEIELAHKKIEKDYLAKNSSDSGQEIPFDLEWTQVPSADTYEVEVFESESNTSIKKINTRSPASALPLSKPGRYKYKVRALDSKGRTVSSSGFGEISYNRIFDLVAPIIKNEFKNMFFFFQNESARYIWLNWLSQGSEVNFRLEISSDYHFRQIVKAISTQNQKYLMTDRILAGDYFWRVRSQVNDRSSDWSDIQKFKVKINQAL